MAWGMWAGAESLRSRIPAERYRVSTRPQRVLPDSLSDLAKSQPRSLPGLFQVFAGSLLNPYWISPNLIETPIETL